MRAKFYVLVAGLGLLATAAPIMAHHSFTAEYDAAKPISLTGTVTKVEWMNPHARFYIDVKDDSGTVTNWELELGSPNARFSPDRQPIPKTKSNARSKPCDQH